MRFQKCGFKNIKFHSPLHYGHLMCAIGSSANYDACSSEHAWIRCAKEVYQSTQKRSESFLPQMEKFLNRRHEFDLLADWVNPPSSTLEAPLAKEGGAIGILRLIVSGVAPGPGGQPPAPPHRPPRIKVKFTIPATQTAGDMFYDTGVCDKLYRSLAWYMAVTGGYSTVQEVTPILDSMLSRGKIAVISSFVISRPVAEVTPSPLVFSSRKLMCTRCPADCAATRTIKGSRGWRTWFFSTIAENRDPLF